MDPSQLQEDVKKAMAEAAETPPANQPEDVTPEGVKPEETKVEETKVETVKPDDQFTTQIENLNKALRIEREEKKQMEEKLRKEFEEKMKSEMEIVQKIKEAFTPVPENQEPPAPTYMTKEEFEQELARREEARKEEQEKYSQAELIKKEISELENEWDGKEGKPKYDDEEVLRWQQENNKLFLSPKEAFMLKNQREILDWEVKQRLSHKKDTPNTERPSGGGNEPVETKPQTDQELRNAVIEAMKNASHES